MNGLQRIDRSSYFSQLPHRTEEKSLEKSEIRRSLKECEREFKRDCEKTAKKFI
jgi:hypothetical protein